MKNLLFIFIIFSSIVLFAHVPFFHESQHNKIYINDVYLSQIHYFEFTEEYDDIKFKFYLEKEKNLYILLGVPKIDRLEDFNFMMDIKDSNNKIIDSFDTSKMNPDIMYEPFGDTYSWEYLRYDESLSEGYYEVELTTKENGKFWIAFGKREEFTAEQILNLPKLIKGIRDFHELEGRATWEKYALGITIGLVSFLFALKYF